MRLVDTHNHTYLPEFENDIDQVTSRAKSSGVVKSLLPNIDSSTIPSLKSLSDSDPNFYLPMMGLHPTSVKDDFEIELELIFEELDKGGYIAVGEIGIDLYWDKTYVKEQIEVFRRQILKAIEMKIPVAIHVRDSFDEVFEQMDDLNNEDLGGVFHCFTGDIQQAQKILEYSGFMLGIGGVVTFKNGKIDQFLKEIPLENIILETDAPYLAPVPFRGKRNESSYIVNVAEKLSEVYSMPKAEIAEVTTQNAVELFNLKV